MASNAYWLERAEREMDYLQAAADKRLATIGRAMYTAQKQLTEDVARIFHTFANRFDLTEDQARALLLEPAPRSEYLRLLSKIKAMPKGAARTALEARASSGAYAFRISRLEVLQENIALETAKVSQVIEDELTGQLRFTAVEGYNRRMYDVQRQTSSAFAVPDIRGMKVAINTPWAGASYSARIWGAQAAMAETLKELVSSAFLSGESNASIAQAIKKQFGVSFREAERLVRTETSYIANKAAMQSYTDSGVELYTYKTAWDDRTCDICLPRDRQKFCVSDAQVGVNYPPLHPHCRCVTAAVVDEDTGAYRERRGADGNIVRIPKDFSYTEWQKWQGAGAPDDIEAWRKAA